MKHIRGLDTLRALAVFFVLIEHWGPSFATHSFGGIFERFFIPTGPFGVNLFFVLSGFLITAILLKANNENSNKLSVVKNFVMRRSLRIFPIYYLALAFLFIINYSFIRENFWYFATYTSNILVYKNNSWNTFSHTWSLSVEEQFYLIWPWIIIFINQKYLKYALFAFIGIGVVSTFLTLKVFHGFGGILSPNCFDAFGLGGLYAYAHLNEARLKKFQSILKFTFPVAVLVYFFWKFAPYGGYIEHFNFCSRTIDSVIALGIINFVITTRSKWINNKLFENKFLNRIGKISYGIYLYHFALGIMYDNFVGQVFQQHSFTSDILTNPYLSILIKFALVYGISYLSFELIEKRVMNYKKLFDYNKTETQTVKRPVFAKFFAHFA